MLVVALHSELAAIFLEGSRLLDRHRELFLGFKPKSGELDALFKRIVGHTQTLSIEVLAVSMRKSPCAGLAEL